MYHDVSKDHLALISMALNNVPPVKDQSLFTDFSDKPFSVSDDFSFEGYAALCDAVRSYSLGCIRIIICGTHPRTK